MDIAVIGAAGSVGRAVCGQLLATRVLQRSERLQLVGRHGGASDTGIFGLRIDLLDAYSETAPQIEQVLDPAQIRADVIVMVAGDTPAADAHVATTRDDVARTNIPVFEYYAAAIAEHGSGRELIVIQSNPVELAVDIFARHLGRHRVVGAGSYSDSLRLRREIADDLFAAGNRPIVSGYLLGEHGPNAVPVWSSLRAAGTNPEDLQDYIRVARGHRHLSDLPAQVADARAHLSDLVSAHDGEAAFAFAATLPPDVGALVKPWFAHWSGRTSVATAHAVVDLIAQLSSGHRMVLPLQVATQADDWPGINGVLGVPVDIDMSGWTRTVPLDLPADESAALLAAASAISERLAIWQA
jgi:malate dehydrogenase